MTCQRKGKNRYFALGFLKSGRPIFMCIEWALRKGRHQMVRIIFIATVLVVFALAAPALAQGQQGVPEGMVLIQAGEFMMGSEPGEGSDDEHPPHKVYVDAFYMDKYEVTVGQYKAFMNATGHRALPDWASKYSPTDNHPVVGVSWDDARAYARWVGKRLPTEAEWEKACRAGTISQYNTGTSINHDDANYSGTGGKGKWTDIAPVGSFAPNSWGLYDMAGNVWEWCSDWYDKDYYSSSPSNNPRGPANGQYRVSRGGSWIGGTDYLRSAYRGSHAPTHTSDIIGFRCSHDLK
jgi:sulfatase modifying factor 1